MKAVQCKKYGSPEVLYIKDMEKPTPKENEVLIRIRATVAAPADSAFRKGNPAVARLFTGLSHPKQIPGDVIAGTIEAVGKDVTRFKVGDEVYGSSGAKFGSNAEYITLAETEAIFEKPGNASFEEAAAISEGAITALPFLRDSAKIKKGDRVLIIGASGGVGVYAVQLAKHLGAHVTGVCGPGNQDLVRGLGADQVIDYTKTDYLSVENAYRIIFDAVGKSSFPQCKKALLSGGVYMTTVPTGSSMIHMLLTSIAGKKKAVFSATGIRKPADKIKDLELLRQLIEEGTLKPVIDRSYSLFQISEAHRYVDTGHKRGSVVVKV
ncbi:MAG: NAD(P)-dependent alcohol dehydrogenase [Clostridiaceae bacterium]|nr:NAD(P)-dependent alcohol dehydrogenase [Clostridiaceae bacterium]